jgi:hypothetical protein
MEAPTVRAPSVTASPAFGTLPCEKSGKFHISIGENLQFMHSPSILKLFVSNEKGRKEGKDHGKLKFKLPRVTNFTTHPNLKVQMRKVYEKKSRREQWK